MSAWNLSITPAQFESIYQGSVDIDIFRTSPTTDEELVTKYFSCKLWRLNNLYTIVDKKGNRTLFNMNLAQHVVYAASLQHARLVILKSRQQGISTFWLVAFLDEALVNPDFKIGLMAQGQSEAGTLLERTELAWETINPVLLSILGVSRVKDNSSEQGFSNNSTLFIRTSFRSTTLQGLHVSELGKIAKTYPDRAKEVKTGTLQAIQPGNTVAIESTAEGDNLFKDLWDAAVEAEAKVLRLNGGVLPLKGSGKPSFAGEDFKPVFLSWVDDPDCWQEEPEEPSQTQLDYFDSIEQDLGIKLSVEQRNFWVSKYRTLGEDIKQEYPTTPEEAFTKANDGAYYAALFLRYVLKRGRIKPQLYDENLPTHAFLDLGMSDTFVIIYVQVWQEGNTPSYRIIDEYTRSGEGLAHYVDQLNSVPYNIARVYCPHDIEVRELSTGKSRKARLRELGVTNIVVLKRTSIEAGIEQVRRMIPHLWIDSRCTYIKGCLQNYSKDWDGKLQVWKSSPRHDKWSHGADCLRGFAISNLKYIASDTNNTRDAASVSGGVAI